MGVLSGLEPSRIWHYFEEISKIPRLSKNEGKIRRYLLQFAEQNNLRSKEDEIGNILITREAASDLENRRTVVLQSHMDMVGEKNSGNPHNWETDPVTPVLKGDWVTAKGTTLGADDGMGIACQLAILSDKNLKCGKIECLFTVDEESGMTGAINLSPGFFEGRTLINLDSEDEGILFIGCAGGTDSVGRIRYESLPVSQGMAAMEISLTGLHGGHSGDEIHKGYGNSLKLMNRFLLRLDAEKHISIAHFSGGNLRNAIPREAFSTIIINRNDTGWVNSMAKDFSEALTKELGDLEKELSLSAKSVPVPATMMDAESQKKFMELLSNCPHGVIAWSRAMDDLVETSTNLASAKFEAGDIIQVVTTQRSSVEASKYEIAGTIEKLMKDAGAVVTHSGGYPGWEPDLNSAILKITKESYKKLFGKEPLVRAIHAGLECGLIYEKINDIDMISFGPTIKGAHTPDEMIEISTAQKFWDLLVDVLKNISVK